MWSEFWIIRSVKFAGRCCVWDYSLRVLFKLLAEDIITTQTSSSSSPLTVALLSLQISFFDSRVLHIGFYTRSSITTNKKKIIFTDLKGNIYHFKDIYIVNKDQMFHFIVVVVGGLLLEKQQKINFYCLIQLLYSKKYIQQRLSFCKTYS